MSDYEKYLKYKKKYLELRQNSLRRMEGGGNGIFPIEDEIFFWSRQITEHMLLLFLGLEDPTQELKQQAFQLYRQWMAYLKTNFLDKGIEAKPDLVVLAPDNLKLIGQLDTNEILELINQTEEYQTRLLSILGRNEWIGWIFPTLLMHMQKETIYFKRKLIGPPFTPEEEIAFINTHNGEEIGATGQLIDPAPENTALIQKAHAYASKTMPEWSEADKKILQGMDVTEQATLLRVSLKYSKELTDMAAETGMKIDARQIKTIISPVLAKHIYREFARFTLTLQALGAKA